MRKAVVKLHERVAEERLRANDAEEALREAAAEFKWRATVWLNDPRQDRQFGRETYLQAAKYLQETLADIERKG